MPSVRADAELVRRGLARSRKHASALVLSGRVQADGHRLSKPAAPVTPATVLDVTPDPADPGFASRAGGKLDGALQTLADDARGSVLVDRLVGADCLDLGASTGGFTDVLLRRGARHVTALDVGHGQLVDPLRRDERVRVIEGFNVRDLTPADLTGAPDLVVADLSFISLRLVVGPVAGVLPPGAPALLLVKPQFEVGRERLGSGGVVRDAALHTSAVADVVRAAHEVGLQARAVVPSPLPGPSGNREFFCWFERTASVPVPPPDDTELLAAVRSAVAWEPDGTLPPVTWTTTDGTRR